HRAQVVPGGEQPWRLRPLGLRRDRRHDPRGIEAPSSDRQAPHERARSSTGGLTTTPTGETTDDTNGSKEASSEEDRTDPGRSDRPPRQARQYPDRRRPGLHASRSRTAKDAALPARPVT